MSLRMRVIAFFYLFLFHILSAHAAAFVLVNPIPPVDSAPFSIVILGTECRDPSQDLVEYSEEERIFRISLTITANTCPEQDNSANNFRTTVGPLSEGTYDIFYRGSSPTRVVLGGHERALTFNVVKLQGFMELPTPNEVVGGKGKIEGWVCTANKVELNADNSDKVLARYKIPRPDTFSICNDSDNGFVFDLNWNILGAGPHTIRAFADGVEFASRNIVVDPVVNGFLETPSQGSDESGIGLIAGWVCDASEVTVHIDSFPPIKAIHGSPRSDTVAACGSAENGFASVMNWSLLGDGQHNVRVVADGVQFASATFSVKTFGTAFFRHGPEDFRLPGFPDASKDTIIQWSERHQNFLVRQIVTGAASPVVETPTPEIPVTGDEITAKQADRNLIVSEADAVSGSLDTPGHMSLESGIGIIQGWVCDANNVTIQIDSLARVAAIYGVERGDTEAVCGDVDNGFGLIYNWGLLSDGVHVLKAFANNVEFASVGFRVTTYGTPFLLHAPVDYTLEGFPAPGQSTVVRWAQPHQNFMIVDVQ